MLYTPPPHQALPVYDKQQHLRGTHILGDMDVWLEISTILPDSKPQTNQILTTTQ